MKMGPEHHRLIRALLLACSVISLLLILKFGYFPTPPGMDGPALAATFNGGQPVPDMYARFARGAMEHRSLSNLVRNVAPAIVALTVLLAVWNFKLSKKVAAE